jgi:hypothetical protein
LDRASRLGKRVFSGEFDLSRRDAHR